MRDILHLDKRHGGLLEFYAGRSDGQVDEPVGYRLARLYTSKAPVALVITYLQRAVPSLSPSRRSFEGSLAPRTPSIHDLASLAAAGVYLSRRILRKSLSKDVTDAIITEGVFVVV